jgi:hypothetical protein
VWPAAPPLPAAPQTTYRGRPGRPCEARKIGSCGRWLFFVSISAASNRTGVGIETIRHRLDGTCAAYWMRPDDWEFRDPLTYD